MASLTVTYIFWLFGGIFGLHHLYLGRMYHAFVWCSTLGGVMGIGWVREFRSLPDYVKSSNADEKYKKAQLHRIALKPMPSCGFPRFSGLLVMGYLITSVMIGLLPNDYDEDPLDYPFVKKCLVVTLALVGSSIGVYIVANVGEVQCSWQYPVVGALLSILWLYTYSIKTPWGPVYPNAGHLAMVSPLISTLVTWWRGLRWKPIEPLKKNRKAKCGKFIVFVVVWTSLVSYALYQNVTISVDGITRIPFKVALADFLASSAWHQTKQSLYLLFRALIERCLERVFQAVHYASDIFIFLDEMSTSNGDIVRNCRQLLAQNHPDRFKTHSEKRYAHTKFIEIQDACSTLTKHYSKRRTRP